MNKTEIIIPLAPFANMHRIIEWETEEQFDKELKRVWDKYHNYFERLWKTEMTKEDAESMADASIDDANAEINEMVQRIIHEQPI